MWGATGLKDTACLSARYLQSPAALAMPSAPHTLSAISALRDDAKHAGTNPRKHLATHKLSSEDRKEKEKGSMQAPTLSYCQAENRIDDFSQRIPNHVKVAHTEVTCCSRTVTVSAWGSVEKHDFGSTLALTSHLPRGDTMSQQLRCVKEDKYSPQQKAGIGGM